MQKLLLVLILAALTANPALADRINKREELQQKRIAHGIASGELNPKEAAHLEKQQDRIDNLENKVEADGVVTRKEKAKVEIVQDHASHAIYRKKHNAR